jgi:hypothetical protein
MPWLEMSIGVLRMFEGKCIYCRRSNRGLLFRCLPGAGRTSSSHVLRFSSAKVSMSDINSS